MTVQVLSVLVAASLFSFTYCSSNNPKTDAVTLSWRFPVSRGTPKSKIGKQMPPHPEPDAVLINVGEHGQPRMPEEGFPGLPGGPGIFGAPRDPGVFGFPSPGAGPEINTGPGVFGVPQGPGVFGVPLGPGVFGVPQEPGAFGIPQGPGVFGVPQEPGAFGIPQGPGVFGVPQEPGAFGIPQEPGIFGIPQGLDSSGIPGIPQGPGVYGIPQGPGVYGIPQGPGVIGIPRLPGFPDTFNAQGFPFIPGNPTGAGIYGQLGILNGPSMFVTQRAPMSRSPRVGQNRPGITLGTGIFVAPGGPGDLGILGQRGVFAVAGSGDPFSGSPNFFYPKKNPYTPGRFPETFVPPSEDTFPGVFYPNVPTAPNPPKGNFPGWEKEGGREFNDEPTAESFPLMDTPSKYFRRS